MLHISSLVMNQACWFCFFGVFLASNGMYGTKQRLGLVYILTGPFIRILVDIGNVQECSSL